MTANMLSGNLQPPTPPPPQPQARITNIYNPNPHQRRPAQNRYHQKRPSPEIYEYNHSSPVRYGNTTSYPSHPHLDKEAPNFATKDRSKAEPIKLPSGPSLDTAQESKIDVLAEDHAQNTRTASPGTNSSKAGINTAPPTKPAQNQPPEDTKTLTEDAEILVFDTNEKTPKSPNTNHFLENGPVHPKSPDKLSKSQH